MTKVVFSKNYKEPTDTTYFSIELIKSKKLKSSEVITYQVLATHTDRESIAEIPLSQLALEVNCSVRTIQRTLEALETKGFIKKFRERVGDTNKYWVSPEHYRL